MRRRHFLQGAALALALPAIPVHAGAKGRTTFVLLHGAWHSSAHWARVVAPLAARGHGVVTLDLPGHGVHARFPASYFGSDRSKLLTEPSPLRDLTLEQAADAVITTLKPLRAQGRVVLVGHSMAGHMLSRVAEREPALVDRLVYLAAFMPVDRPSFADYMALPEARTEYGNTVGLGDPSKIGAARIDPRSQDEAYLDRLHAAFYGDVDKPTFRAFANSLTPDQPAHYFLDSPRVTRERWGRVPRTYLLTERDGAMAPALQALFIREADAYAPGNQTRVVRLDTSHSPFASQPEELARLLAAER